MFGRSPLDTLENSFLRSQDKQEQLFNRLFVSLDGIREEIHKTNEQMHEYRASHQLELVKVKKEILEVCFDKFIEKNSYDLTCRQFSEELARVRIKLKDKPDTKSLKIVWSAICAFCMAAAWVVATLLDLKAIP